jgi:biliverdin reductase
MVPEQAAAPLQVGIVGTGYAAKLRAQALQADARAGLIAVAGRSIARTQEFCQPFGATAIASWEALIQDPALDLVVVATVNRDHGAIVRAALTAGKHVVVEYPLALDLTEAEELLALARAQNRLLHVEHIELLGGLHQALKSNLPQIGQVFYARYATIAPQRPAPQKWTYHRELFGFPLIGALSRLHRLLDLFGPVVAVSCQARFWDASLADCSTPYYAACLCKAQLRFQTGLLADVVYGKGETLWQAERSFQVQGDRGALLFEGEEGRLVSPEETQPIPVGSRRGLFAKDTEMVLDHLTTGAPLYVTAAASVASLRVADAARRSAETQQTIAL